MNFKRIAASLIAILTLVPIIATALPVAAADDVISLGKSYTVEYSTPIDNTYPSLKYTEETSLTDGVTAKAASNDPNWLKLYRGTEAIVTIDLESVMSVSAVVLTELQMKSAGIYCSRYLDIYVSENGTDYGFVGRSENPALITNTGTQRVTLKAVFDQSYKARYVRAVFTSDVFTYVDEIQVLGSSDASGAASADITEEKAKDYSGDLDGIKSICLMYASSQYTADMIKPYFAYVEKSGEVKNAMFDSLLFLGMPSRSGEGGKVLKNDMIAFANDIFAEGRHIDALNTVVGEYKDDLGYAEDYKYPIFISVPFPELHDLEFGEINGNTVIPNTLETRTEIVKWYVDYIEQRFNESSLDNLELKGYYWFEESINRSISTHEEELVAAFNDYVHEKGYKTMWIPYFSSSGVDEAKDLGFDSVTMQSGYAFGGGSETGEPNEKSVIDAVEAAKKYGLNGLELEVDLTKDDYAKKLKRYISAAYNAGLQEKGMVTMYQVGDNLYRSATSNGITREIYELTYKYISGQYTECAPVIKEGATVTVKVDSYAMGELEIIDEDSKKAELKIANIEKPEGIFFAAEGNGFFEVQTYGAEPGTYVARLSVTDGLSESNTVEITIIVEGAEAPESSEPSDGGEEKGNCTVIIVVIAVVAVAAIAAAAVLILKKKRK